ncbi:beta-1,6-N-acetylglucosaminyltransferase [Mangrovimonas sp. TPBH4]|uniref:beta-1,6-N-acetylglucosaminyltransferase n=1 Tax=Mangrovimonas sp. TPBH4 TaxID=1645914 RepID=UPI0006B673A6|nr:beta-1,6-N-acetylglucosaminyltransferase [Mangrovimonas sp. TPBH4]
MTKIYLILAHKSPLQLRRQITALNELDSYFYIHIDLKSDLDQFENVTWSENVFFINDRVDCIWGDFSIVRATLNLIQIALKNHSEGICVLLSGNCYPIKSLSHIDTFFNEYKNKVFIDIDDAEVRWWDFYKRVEYYRINLNSKRGQSLLLKGFNLETLKHFVKRRISIEQLFKILFVKRNLSLDMKFYGGSQWWAMDLSKLALVNNFIEQKQKILFDFFSYSHVPDEFFFNSIVMYLKKLNHDIEIETIVTHADWGRKNCKLPVTFELADFKELVNLPFNILFARKFDIHTDSLILDELDKYISAHN